METVKVKDKTFRVSVPAEEIDRRIQAVAERINNDMRGRNPLFLAVLNGSFMFVADLMRKLTIPCEVAFVRLASYEGTSSVGRVTEILGLDTDVRGRTVVIVEDIVDTGLTMKSMLETLGRLSPESLHVCSLLVKPGNMKVDLDIEYAVMSVANDFVVGYGLDYDQQGRNLPAIYTVVE